VIADQNKSSNSMTAMTIYGAARRNTMGTPPELKVTP